MAGWVYVHLLHNDNNNTIYSIEFNYNNIGRPKYDTTILITYNRKIENLLDI